MNDGIGGLMLSLLILLFLTMTNAFFAMSEIAIISTNEKKIQKLAEEGNKKAAHLSKLIASQSAFLATIQVGVTLSGFLSSAVAAENFAGMLAGALSFLPVNHNVISGVSLVVITVILSYFTLIFGELVPKRFAQKYAEKISLSVSGFLWGFYKVARPFVSLLSASTNGVLKLCGMSAEDEEVVTEEDILMLVDAGEETGAIRQNEREMIQNVLKFDDRDVCDVMTPRPDMVILPEDSTVQEALAVSNQEGYSRIPVFQGNFDNITGVLFVKDLIGPALRGEGGAPISKYLRPVLYVPETKLCRELMAEFKSQKSHMAIVVDEYGGTSGLVTMEDLLESIVGDIEDESDHPEPEEIQKLAEDIWLFDGGVSMEDAAQALDIRLDEEELENDTLAGWVLEQLGSIPTEGETLKGRLAPDYDVTVKRVDDHRIEEILVHKRMGVSQPQPVAKTAQA